MTGFSLACLMIMGTGAATGAASDVAQGTNWALVYSADADPRALGQYDLVVLDSLTHPPLQPIKSRGAEVYGYLSIGEADGFRPHYERARELGLIIGENPNWPDNFMVDVRADVWLEMLIYEVVPRIIQSGFDGLMLDTADSAIHLEQTEPARFAGMSDAVVRLVKALRANFPDTKLIINRGYGILERIGGDIDYILAESLYTDYDFETNEYRIRDEAGYRWQTDQLYPVMKANPGLRVLSLDYWHQDDTETIREIYRFQRTNGFLPYVSTIDLQTLYPEPDR